MKLIKFTKRIISVMFLLLLTLSLFFSSSILLDSVAKEQNISSDTNIDENIMVNNIFELCYTVDYKVINPKDNSKEKNNKYAPELTEEQKEKIKELEAQKELEITEELDYNVIDVDPYDQYITIELNIRTYPSSDNEETIIDVAPFASMVTIIGKVEDSNWVKIKYKSDKDDKKDIDYAFIYGGYFSNTKPQPIVIYNEQPSTIQNNIQPDVQNLQPEVTESSSTNTNNTQNNTQQDVQEPQPDVQNTYVPQTGCLTARAGVFNGPSGKETYYNLNMNGVISIMRDMGYTEEEYPYWVREDGCKMFGQYIMVAANLNIRPKGTILSCSLGTAIVVDTGGFAASNPNQLDIATNW